MGLLTVHSLKEICSGSNTYLVSQYGVILREGTCHQLFTLRKGTVYKGGANIPLQTYLRDHTYYYNVRVPRYVDLGKGVYYDMKELLLLSYKPPNVSIFAYVSMLTSYYVFEINDVYIPKHYNFIRYVTDERKECCDHWKFIH